MLKRCRQSIWHYSISINDKNSQQTKNKPDQGNLQKLIANVIYKGTKATMTPFNTPIKHYTGSLMQCNKPWKKIKCRQIRKTTKVSPFS